jgi:hypothetical protein
MRSTQAIPEKTRQTLSIHQSTDESDRYPEMQDFKIGLQMYVSGGTVQSYG